MLPTMRRCSQLTWAAHTLVAVVQNVDGSIMRTNGSELGSKPVSNNIAVLPAVGAFDLIEPLEIPKPEQTGMPDSQFNLPNPPVLSFAREENARVWARDNPIRPLKGVYSVNGLAHCSELFGFVARIDHNLMDFFVQIAFLVKLWKRLR